MDVDDSPEKLRRNVVVFSVLILAAFYLDINLPEQIPFLGKGLSSADPRKLWALVMAALLYLFLRYHFDSATKAHKEYARAELKNMRTIWVRAKIQDSVKDFLWRSRKTRFLERISVGLQSVKEKQERSGQKLKPDDIDVYVDVGPIFEMQSWKGSTTVVISFKKSIADKAEPETCHVGFAIPWIDQIAMTIAHIARLSFASKSAVDLITPYSLAFLASVVITYRYITSY